MLGILNQKCFSITIFKNPSYKFLLEKPGHRILRIIRQKKMSIHVQINAFIDERGVCLFFSGFKILFFFFRLRFPSAVLGMFFFFLLSTTKQNSCPFFIRIEGLSIVVELDRSDELTKIGTIFLHLLTTRWDCAHFDPVFRLIQCC